MPAPQAPPDPHLFFNGINALTGDYGLAPIARDDLTRWIRAQAPPIASEDLKARWKQDQALQDRQRKRDSDRATFLQLTQDMKIVEEQLLHPALTYAARAELTRELQDIQRSMGHLQDLGAEEGVDTTDLAQAGWGAVFPAPRAVDTAAIRRQEEIRDALKPLLTWRENQAKGLYKLFFGATGYRLTDRKEGFLKRIGAAPSGPVTPKQVPYFLLLVGSPDEIPFSIQYQLDVQYAVGRLHFDTLKEYAQYAQNVIETESGGQPRPRRMSLFGTRHAGDRATEASSSLLVEPLHRQIGELLTEPGSSDVLSGWEVDLALGPTATKSRFARYLDGGNDTPALLFAATHGLEFPADAAAQRAHQGAPLCGDSPGPGPRAGAVPDDHFFSGQDLKSSADLRGLVMFSFACFSAGAPAASDAVGLTSLANPHLPARPFVSGFAQALLGRPRGPLAVIGHVDRAWTCSFTGPSPGTGPAPSYIETFRSTIMRILGGDPLGHALDYFNQRYAEVSTTLGELLARGEQADPYELLEQWSIRNDARNYIIVGDPAVRLRVAATASAESIQGARPPNISEADWMATPHSVKEAVWSLLAGRR